MDEEQLELRRKIYNSLQDAYADVAKDASADWIGYATVKNELEGVLYDHMMDGLIGTYSVVCDASNNPPDDSDCINVTVHYAFDVAEVTDQCIILGFGSPKFVQDMKTRLSALSLPKH